jgi:hypothetical protein
MKILSPLLILLISFISGYASPQKQPLIFSVTYQNTVNGKTRSDDAGIKLLCSAESSKSWVAKDSAKLLPEVASETSYIDYVQKKTYQVARFANGSMINYQLPFSDYPVLAETNETAVILGYHCKKVITSLRSNSIEIWYSTEPGVKGTPAVSSGVPDGLVLKVVRNGNFTITATEIKALKQKDIISILPEQMGETLGLPLYKHRITESLVTTIKVFSNEQVSYGNKIANPADPESTKTFKYSSGTILLKKINLPVFDDDTQLFTEVYQHSEGDAYDRTGSVFIIPMDKERSFLDGLKNGIKELPTFVGRNGKSYQGVVATQTFSPLIELMRFFTPFGIGEFNDKSKVYGQHWEDSTYYKQDITELLPLMQGERLIGIFIGNYDKGGHRVTLNLKYYPGSREKTNKPAKKYWSLPLFNTLNVMEMSGQEYGTMFDNDSLSAEVTIPSGIKNLQLRYITTGHGGWGGGDEFNLKINTILLDRQVLFQFGPWRCDCATYRKYNPASGNFWNGTSSSDYSRSGWCPGTATNPVYFPISHLSPGKHKFSVAIPLGKSEGGSFSSWNVSAILLGEYE